MPTPSTSSPTSTFKLSGNATIDPLLDETLTKWGGSLGTGANLTFSFPWINGNNPWWQPNYSTDNPQSATYHFGLSAVEMIAARAALQVWANVANIKLTEVADTSTVVGDFRFAFSSGLADTVWGYCVYPNNYWANSADVWINSAHGSEVDWSFGSYNFEALAHEIGHGLGLKHPGNYNGSGSGTPPYIQASLDVRNYSIMSYTDPANDVYWDSTARKNILVCPETPMVYDIQAIQYLYGANTSYHSGDDTYSFSPTSPFYKTIWDAGGVDTIDVGNFSLGCSINLNPGSYSTVAFASPDANHFNGTNDLGIAFGAIIENARGGSGADTLTGNQADNSLSGGGGSDLLHGGSGNDTLNGDAGNDILWGDVGDDILSGGDGFDIAAYSGPRASYTITKNANNITVSGPDGVDVLTNVEEIQFSDTYVIFNTAPTGAVTISGTALQNQKLSVVNTLADLDGLGTIAYQWKADGVVISGATQSSMTLSESQVGKVITVIASYTDGHGTAESVSSSATTSVVNVNDLPTGALSVSGTATEGQSLSAISTLADLDGLGTLSYQWLADGTAISGATANTFLLAKAQIGKAVTVQASYTDGHGTAESVLSTKTALVAALNHAPTGTVTVTGTAIQGQTLTTSNTLADADGLGSISYQWQANGTSIAGATGDKIVLAEEQVGKTISVTASYKDGLGTLESQASIATGAVVNVNDAPTGGLTLLGEATQGKTLTLNNTVADLDGLGTLNYQWLSDGKSITGATSSSLVLTEAQVGKAISVTTSYTDGHGTLESVTSGISDKVANVNDAPVGNVSIGGDATQGQTLTASNALSDRDGLGLVSYQWRADGADINGATTNKLLLAESQVGRVITVSASYTDGHGTQESVASIATSVVANVNDAPTGDVSISGNAQTGLLLTGSNTLSDIDGLGTIKYQWMADGAVIAGATSSTLVLDQSQLGKGIAVQASYTDGHGTQESVTSGVTALVATVIAGTAGNDVFTGGAGNDTISGGDGSDWIYGGGGADTINGDAGNDYLYGQAGDDILNGGDGADIVSGGDGNDTLSGGNGDDGMYGDAGNDTMSGNAGGDFIAGGDGNDIMHGDDGQDWIYGEWGDDTLYGDAGNDFLFGNFGNDTLIGGTGNDLLYGGEGADTFVFVANQGEDFIMDFSPAQGDHISIASGTNDITTPAQALAKVHDSGANALLDLGNGNYVMLMGVSTASLNVTDFAIA